MKNTASSYLLFFLLCCELGFAKEDSSTGAGIEKKADTTLVNLLNTSAKECYEKGKYDSALIFAVRARGIAEKLRYTEGIAEALTHEGMCQSKAKKYHEALMLHQRALKIRIAGKDKNTGYSNYNIGSCLQWLNRYKDASVYFFRSVRLAEAAKDSILLYKSFGSIAYLLQFMGTPYESITYQKKSLQYVNPSTQQENYCLATIFLANYYALNNECDDADSILTIAGRIAERLNSPYHLSYYYTIKSEIRAQQAKWGEAINSLKEANKYEQKLTTTENLPYNYANIANYILKCDKKQLAIAGISVDEQFDASIRNAQLSLDITIPSGIVNITSANYYHISEALRGKGNYKEAFRFYKMHTLLKDSIFNVRNLSTTQELKLKYEADKNESEIKFLKKQHDLNEAYKAIEKSEKNFAYAGLIAVLLSGSYVYYLYAKSRKLSKELSRSLKELKSTQQQIIRLEKEKVAEKTRSELSRDLHDDLGASLSSISVYSAVARNRLNKNNLSEVDNMLERISTDAQELAHSVGEKVWLMKSGNNTMEKITEYLQLFASGVLTAKNISFRFHCEDQLQALNLNADVCKNIYLIFKEGIINAGKYSGGNQITFTAQLTGNKLDIQLADNGQGFERSLNNKSGQKTGNGLNHIEQRAKEINAEISITSSLQSGTKIRLVYPLPINRENVLY